MNRVGNGRKTAGLRLLADAVRRNVEHTGPCFLPANCRRLYSALSSDQVPDARFMPGKRWVVHFFEYQWLFIYAWSAFTGR